MTAPTALIAEDEPLLAAALKADLAALWPGLQLLPLQADGRSALEAALAQLPDLCFLDIRLPALSGLEVAAALAEDWPDGRAFPCSEGTSGRNYRGQCGRAGGAGAHGLTDVCSRPRRRALNFIELARVTKVRGSKAPAFVLAVGDLAGAAPERRQRSDREA